MKLPRLRRRVRLTPAERRRRIERVRTAPRRFAAWRLASGPWLYGVTAAVWAGTAAVVEHLTEWGAIVYAVAAITFAAAFEVGLGTMAIAALYSYRGMALLDKLEKDGKLPEREDQSGTGTKSA